ncbi:hypothetical protein B0H12DRAFT_1071369 [Mycena haematopus]|nr:hypothetical protein B0H12DRAFT_1071369 [Mycena haematopus]
MRQREKPTRVKTGRWLRTRTRPNPDAAGNPRARSDPEQPERKLKKEQGREGGETKNLMFCGEKGRKQRFGAGGRDGGSKTVRYSRADQPMLLADRNTEFEISSLSSLPCLPLRPARASPCLSSQQGSSDEWRISRKEGESQIQTGFLYLTSEDEYSLKYFVCVCRGFGRSGRAQAFVVHSNATAGKADSGENGAMAQDADPAEPRRSRKPKGTK